MSIPIILIFDHHLRSMFFHGTVEPFYHSIWLWVQQRSPCLPYSQDFSNLWNRFDSKFLPWPECIYTGTLNLLIQLSAAFLQPSWLLGSVWHKVRAICWSNRWPPLCTYSRPRSPTLYCCTSSATDPVKSPPNFRKCLMDSKMSTRTPIVYFSKYFPDSGSRNHQLHGGNWTLPSSLK